jgi:hypothetical protein
VFELGNGFECDFSCDLSSSFPSYIEDM